MLLSKPLSKSLPKIPKPSPYQINVGTGSSFTGGGIHYGKDPLARNLKATFKAGKRSTFSNIHPGDKKYLHDLIAKHAQKLGTGTGISRHERVEMKRQVQKDVEDYKITKYSASDFKKMIDTLK